MSKRNFYIVGKDNNKKPSRKKQVPDWLKDYTVEEEEIPTEGTPLFRKKWFIITSAAIASVLVLSLMPGVPIVPAAIVLGIGFAGVVFFTLTGKKPGTAKSPQTKKLYNELYNKARQDKQLVERLVEFERQKNPGGSESEWLESALYRWERDRH